MTKKERNQFLGLIKKWHDECLKIDKLNSKNRPHAGHGLRMRPSQNTGPNMV